MHTQVTAWETRLGTRAERMSLAWHMDHKTWSRGASNGWWHGKKSKQKVI